MFCALALNLCLALAGLASSVLMAPERGAPLHAMHIIGCTDQEAGVAGAADNGHAMQPCGSVAGPDHPHGSSHGGHDHHCPFCHATPGHPPLQAPSTRQAFLPQDAWVRARALQCAAQGRNINHSPRAPPVG